MIAELGSSIEFQMSLLLFVALAGYLLAIRINQSAVVGEIIVGLMIGPSLLGLITYTDFVASVAHLGAIILLFVIGLEFKIGEIFNVRYGIIALIGVIVPWIGGYLTAMLFGYSTATAIFTGTALTATSIAITANVLREMNQLQTQAAKTIIGAAVIDDVLSLVALSIAKQLATGSVTVLTTAITFLKAIGFLLMAIYLGQKLFKRSLEYVDQMQVAKQYPEFVFIFAMMIAFFYAMGAELLGLSAIVGSFMAGVVLESTTIQHGKDYKEGAEYLHIIFASIFFVSLGILADVSALSPKVIGFLLILTIVAVFTKFFGCYIPARMQKMSHIDAAIIGWGMSPRGEVAMIVALLGLSAGLIGQEIYVTLVLMSLLTTVITPIVLRNFYFTNKMWNE